MRDPIAEPGLYVRLCNSYAQILAGTIALFRFGIEADVVVDQLQPPLFRALDSSIASAMPFTYRTTWGRLVGYSDWPRVLMGDGASTSGRG